MVVDLADGLADPTACTILRLLARTGQVTRRAAAAAGAHALARIASPEAGRLVAELAGGSRTGAVRSATSAASDPDGSATAMVAATARGSCGDRRSARTCAVRTAAAWCRPASGAADRTAASCRSRVDRFNARDDQLLAALLDEPRGMAKIPQALFLAAAQLHSAPDGR